MLGQQNEDPLPEGGDVFSEFRSTKATSSVSNNESSSSSLDQDGSLEESSTETTSPLFVYFTCTVKQKSFCQHTTVRSMPLCLGEFTPDIGWQRFGPKVDQIGPKWDKSKTFSLIY